jgi:hypothetical protein
MQTFSILMASAVFRPLRPNIQSAQRQTITGISQRSLRPKQLCLLQEDEGMKMENVDEWEAAHGSLEYLFICYTSKQFDTNEEKDELHRIAEAAARRAGVDAYWLGCTCIPEDKELVENVYRISDVVRGAHALIVIIGPSEDSGLDESEMLRELGTRMWTFPEVLLSSSKHPISIYMRDCDTDYFRTLSKRNLGKRSLGGRAYFDTTCRSLRGLNYTQSTRVSFHRLAMPSDS